jgi:hypothetical protein
MDKWKTQKDRIRNKEILLKIGVAPIEEMWGGCLR